MKWIATAKQEHADACVPRPKDVTFTIPSGSAQSRGLNEIADVQLPFCHLLQTLRRVIVGSNESD
jgi:hypothetical protein